MMTMSVARRWIRYQMGFLGHTLGNFKKEPHTSDERYEAVCKTCHRGVWISRVYVQGRRRKYYAVTGTPVHHTCLTMQKAVPGEAPIVNILPSNYFQQENA